MLSALIKKQFAEMFSGFFRNKKTGKARSKVGIALYFLLFFVLFIMLAGIFASLAMSFAVVFLGNANAPLYFCLMSTVALILGVFGSVFSTYAGLYLAKDNELLLSLPIPPSRILVARVISVYLMGLLYSGIVMVPTVVVYFLFARPDALSVVLSIISIIALSLLVLVLTCFFGWVIAKISSKLKNKSYITVIISVAFILLYYYFCGNSAKLITDITENADSVMHGFSFVYPLYAMAKGALGDVLSMLIFVLIVAVLCAVTLFILSKTFIGLALSKTDVSKKGYERGAIKSRSMASALFSKELTRFFSSATYMLNCAMGSVFLPVVGVALLVFGQKAIETVNLLGVPKNVFSLLVFFIVTMLSLFNNTCAPSVSLEGKNIWILQTQPIDHTEVFFAKEKLNIAVTYPFAVIGAVLSSIAVKAPILDVLFILVADFALLMFSSAFGLFVNIKHPNLSWMNETVPIKQSFATFVCVFGGVILGIVLTAVGFFASFIMPVFVYYALVSAIFALLSLLVNKWLSKKGTKIFEKLS